MRALADIIGDIAVTHKHIESPIERVLLAKMIRDPRFIVVKEGEPAGEGKFIYPQRQIGKYRADMIIHGCGFGEPYRIWPPKKTVTICVEADGKHHLDQKEYDAERDAYFLSQGIKTLRFTGARINANPEFVINQIYEHIEWEIWN